MPRSLMDYNAFSYLLTLLQNSFSSISRDHWMILNCFFHQTLNHYFSYIGSKEKKPAKFGFWRSTVTLRWQLKDVISFFGCFCATYLLLILQGKSLTVSVSRLISKLNTLSSWLADQLTVWCFIITFGNCSKLRPSK